MTTIEDQVESREDIPLKNRKKSKWYACNEEAFSGSKYVNVAFGSLTIIITVALLIQIYYGDYQVVPHGSVASDSLECSNIGTSVLKQGGNAADAAIASAFCLAVTTPHVTGLDAAGQLLIYDHRTRLLPDVINFNKINVSDSLPRLVLGLMFTYTKYGMLPWKKLIEPSINIAKNGFLISRMLVQTVTNVRGQDIFGRLEPGQLLKRERLADTLSQIANIEDKDINRYLNGIDQINVTRALKFAFHNYNVYVPNDSNYTHVLINNLQKLQQYNFTKEYTYSSEYVCKIAEVTAGVYRQISTYNKFHEGTFSNVAVIDKNDYYVSLVTGMYRPFGTGEMTTHGYVLDVKTPEEFISTRLPIIVTDAFNICGRRLVFGANDVAVTTQLITSLAIANENTTEIVESARFHLLNNGSLGIEDSHLPTFVEETLACLESLSSHNFLVPEPYQSTNIVEKFKDDLKSHSDSRGGGIASRY